MKRIKTYKGLKKGDYLLWESNAKEDNEYSIVDNVIIEDGQRILNEKTAWNISNNFKKQKGATELNEELCNSWKIYKLNNRDIRLFKVKLVVASL